MADAATLAPPPPSSTPPSSGATGDPISDKILGVESQNVATARSSIEKSQRGEESALAGIEKSVEGLKPPTFSPPPMPKVQQTSPQQAWGSAAMIFSLVASAFTRRHLTTAMNAAASALEAFRKGDVDNFNAAFNQWKLLNDQAMKQADFEMERYTAIMGDADRRERLVTQVGDQEQKGVLAELQATGQALGDQLMARTTSIHDANQLLIERMRLKEQMQIQGKNIEETAVFEQDMKEWKADFASKNGRPPTAEETARHMGDIYADIHGAWTPQHIAAWQNTIRNQLNKQGQVGAVWSSVAQKLDTISTASKLPPSSVNQAALADAFTQIINGGRAIRGFQNAMLTQHAGYVDQLLVAAQKLGHGGQLSPAQVKDMINISTSVARDIDSQMRTTIGNFHDTGAALGLPEQDIDMHTLVPSYDPNLVPRLLGGSASRAPPAVGSIEGGYRYMGGDPSVQTNWQKVSP